MLKNVRIRTINPSTVWALDKPNNCTFRVDGAAVAPVNTAAFPDAGGGARRYRVDMAVSQHPDPINYPDSALITVWVCWTEERGTIREISTSRIVW